MTAPNTAAPAPAEKASVVEDFIDIFASPASVFRRRAEGGWGLAFVIVLVLGIGIWFLARPVLAPAIDAEISRAMAGAAKANPQLTAEQLETGRKFGEKMASIGAVVAVPLSIVLVGLVLWVGGKIFGSKADVGQATMIATYAAVPRIIDTLVRAGQAYFKDPTTINSIWSLSLGPARFMDPDKASPVVFAIAQRFDLFTLWATVLLGVGVYAVGKVSKDKAALAAFLVWLVATGFGLLGALRQK